MFKTIVFGFWTFGYCNLFGAYDFGFVILLTIYNLNINKGNRGFLLPIWRNS